MSISHADGSLSPRDSVFSATRSRNSGNLESPNPPSGGDTNLWGSRPHHSDFPLRKQQESICDEERINMNQDRENMSNDLRDMRFEGSGNSGVRETDIPVIPSDPKDFGVPPGLPLTDPKQVQWSYIDPTGKVQGASFILCL